MQPIQEESEVSHSVVEESTNPSPTKSVRDEMLKHIDQGELDRLGVEDK